MALSLRALGCAAVLLPAPAFADVFSPGELARPHAHLEGVENCTQCHPAGKQLSQESCLTCHVELKPGLAAGKGLHGRIAAAERACERCHHDHQGRDRPLKAWGAAGQKGFNHARTGWPLTGAHQGLECKKCHDPRHIVVPQVRAMLDKHPAQETFLGQPTACLPCHFDEHRDQVSDGCQSCHGTKAWKPAPGFNHDKTDYPLTGKHKAVDCDKCHPTVRDDTTPKSAFPAPVSESFLKYAPVPFGACTACHKDVHEGKFGPRCGSCHSTQSWRTIRNASQERAFHDKTHYPLKGEHLDVDCKACHGPFPGGAAKFKGLSYKACGDCHPDAHQGQLGRAPDCEGCHSVEGFQPVRYSLEQHQKTRFRLEGAHATVGCLQCHPKTAALALKVPAAVKADLKRRRRPELFSFAALDFKGALDKCESCHPDVHQGQLKDKPCAACHEAASFSKLTFDHQRDSKYPLEGGHAEVECEKCHAPAVKGGAVRYRELPTKCGGCHADAHARQLQAQGRANECERCHVVKAFKPAPGFKHEPPFTDYLLDGKHAEAACEKCHPKVTVKPGVTAQRFKPLARECEACHADFHRGAFAGFEP